MKRRNFIALSTITASGWSLFSPVHRIFARQQTEGNLSALSDHAGYYTERGGTIGYLSTPDGIVVIDSQFPEQADHFIHRIKEDFSDRFVLLMNTHHHGDHTGGNISFKPYVKRVVAHVNSAKYQRIVAKDRGTEDKQYYPTETFDKEWNDQVGNISIQAQYFGPAHTSGDAVIQLGEENIVHVGDLVFNRLHPYIDRNAGASIRNWITALGQIMKTYGNHVTYIFGHARDPEGVTGKASDLVQMSNYLEALLMTVQQHLNRGDSIDVLDEIKEIRGFEDYGGTRLPNNLKTAWEELQEG